jgi:hypothetical protein
LKQVKIKRYFPGLKLLAEDIPVSGYPLYSFLKTNLSLSIWITAETMPEEKSKHSVHKYIQLSLKMFF